MKRILCLALALLMVCSLTACQEKAEPSETAPATLATETAAPSTEATTLPTEPPIDLFVFDAEASLAENSETVTFRSFQEYEKALNKMGYTEYRGDMVRETVNSGVACRPTSLTYNDEVFRMEFDFLDHEDITNNYQNVAASMITRTGGILYGMLSAPEAGNLSAYQPEDFDYADVMDFSEFMGDSTLFDFDYVQVLDCFFYNIKNDLRDSMIDLTSYYYPGTGHMYNLVYEYEDPEAVVNFPVVLCRSENEELYAASHGFKDKSDFGESFTVDEGTDLRQTIIRYLSSENEYGTGLFYEPGMTLAEWAKSKYAGKKNLFKLSSDGMSLTYASPKNNDVTTHSWIPNADLPIEELLQYDKNGASYIMAYLENTQEECKYTQIRYVEETSDMRMNIYYEAGMTMNEWSQSIYALGSPWTNQVGSMLTYSHQHSDVIESQCCIENIDRPIEEILLRDQDGEEYILAPLLATNENYVVVEPNQSISVMNLKCGSEEYNFLFDEDMSLVDWCASENNKMGWYVSEEDIFYSPDGTYCVKNASTNILRLGNVQRGLYTIVTIYMKEAN